MSYESYQSYERDPIEELVIIRNSTVSCEGQLERTANREFQEKSNEKDISKPVLIGSTALIATIIAGEVITHTYGPLIKQIYNSFMGR